MAKVSRHQKKATRQKLPQVALLLESSHEISRGMLRGILNYVRLYGPWALHIVAGGASDQRMPDLKAWRGSGIIARIPNVQVAGDIVAAGLPTVIIDPADDYLKPSHPLARCCHVQCNSAAVADRAADFFLGNNFTNFAFVGEPTGMNWSRWRQEAFLRLTGKAGFTCAVYPLPTSEEAEWEVERRRMCRWLAKLPKPLAVFAANDARGRQVLNACLIADIPVPYEVAVLGVNNDTLICETSLPPLSSISVDMEQAGYAAAELLDQLMRGTLTKQRCVTYDPHDVVARASTELLHVTDRLVIRALEFVRINAGLNIRVSDVAEHLGVTRRWAEKRFEQTLNRSVLDEIQRVRMETLRALVSQTDQPFTRIAQRCGFTSANHLGIIFKERFGMTMSDFRKQFNVGPLAQSRQMEGEMRKGQ
jgi:LacI family transcriptional regulator